MASWPKTSLTTLFVRPLERSYRHQGAIFEKSERNFVDKNEDDFSRFVRSMLRWVPERKTPELLDDPWLNGG
jgi:hypothetical protein